MDGAGRHLRTKLDNTLPLRAFEEWLVLEGCLDYAVQPRENSIWHVACVHCQCKLVVFDFRPGERDELMLQLVESRLIERDRWSMQGPLPHRVRFRRDAPPK